VSVAVGHPVDTEALKQCHNYCNHTQRGDGEATARNAVRATTDLLFPFIYVLLLALVMTLAHAPIRLHVPWA